MGEEGKKGGKERGTDEEMGDSDERERERQLKTSSTAK